MKMLLFVIVPQMRFVVQIKFLIRLNISFWKQTQNFFNQLKKFKKLLQFVTFDDNIKNKKEIFAK